MSRTSIILLCLLTSLLLRAALASAAVDSVYQWAVPVAPASDQGTRPLARAYLWIPEKCTRVRAVVIGQHNMLEEDILDHPAFRGAMADLGIAIVWVSPSMDHLVASHDSIKRFNTMLSDLANVSGYDELATAPVIPIGHSAHATFPWNFAAWAPDRTLCILSVHGDAPETPLAGFGPQHIHFPDGALDGVPGLMVMGEYEWIDARWAPATVYRTAHLKSPIALLAEPGEGHFAACDDLVNFCAMFIRKCVEQRLPADTTTAPTTEPTLKPIDPAAGWLVQRWKPGIGRTIPPAPFASYGGDAVDAFWAIDQEMAQTIQNYHADMVGKLPELLGFIQDGKLLPATPTHPMYTLKFEPQSDGESFELQTTFLDAVPSMGPDHQGPGKNNLTRWTGLPAGSPLGHANGPILVQRIEGPVQQTGPNTFRLQFYRGSAFDKPVAWFDARQAGDEKVKSAVQQAVMNIPKNTAGPDQTIAFATILDQTPDAPPIQLVASSSAGLPVHFFVREGPATIDGDTVKLQPLPPRAKLPIKITLVAWQWGRSADPKVKSAEPVEASFSIVPKTP